MRIAITGALGHIGSAFIHGIKSGEYDSVLLIDNVSTQRYSSLFNLPSGVNFKFIEADICTADLKELFYDIDVVIHLAAITNASESVTNEEAVEKINVYGTKRVADACLVTETKLIFPSSTSVYTSAASVIDELSPADGQSPYAKSKRKSELYLQQRMKQEGLQFTIFRFGTIYGPSIGMRFHTAVNKFIWQAFSGQAVTVWETALHQTRPYLSVEDAVGAFRYILKNDLFRGEIYNVVSVNTAVADILKTIKKSFPEMKITLVPSPIMNSLSYRVSDDKIRKLGFTKRHSLEAGIARTIRALEVSERFHPSVVAIPGRVSVQIKETLRGIKRLRSAPPLPRNSF